MTLRSTLSGFIKPEQIIHQLFAGPESGFEELYTLIFDPDQRVRYNSLWVWSHLIDNPFSKAWLEEMANPLIDSLLTEENDSNRRLLLAILKEFRTHITAARTDYIDFCMDTIHSTAAHAVRVMCIKQATAFCKVYPVLKQELISIMDILADHEMPPSIAAGRRNALKQLQRIKE